MAGVNAPAAPRIWPPATPSADAARKLGRPAPCDSLGPMVSLAELLPRGSLLDGAMGTELIGRGLDLSVEPPERWNVTRPDAVRDVHARYAAAGAVAVQTNTFGANSFRLAAYGVAGAVREWNAAAVRLARESAPGCAIIGSIGPTGATPPPEGDAILADLEAAFAEQAAALADAGADALHVETMYHPKEARAAVRGCRIGAPGVPVIASFTCRIEAGHVTTGFGFPAESLLQAFLEEGAAGVGVNCTLAPADMLDAVRTIRRRTALPIVARPTIVPTNAAPLLPGEFATGALALIAAGATAVGGCCGTGPADIASARTALDTAMPDLRDAPVSAAPPRASTAA
ncbi:MAG: homocysteine S-methyltransferase family protein [Deltaproteobacteria bacterium]|nr:MAG: homocysteine S-methyltransferase family protein [Deltaproteobacteria bacterium]